MTVEQEFREHTLSRLREAVDATYRADAKQYIGLWADRAPVSLFGALGPSEVGRPAVDKALQGVAERFGNPAMSIRYEIIEVGTNLAYRCLVQGFRGQPARGPAPLAGERRHGQLMQFGRCAAPGERLRR